MLLLLLLGPGPVVREGSRMEARVGAGADELPSAGIDAGPPRCQAADRLDSALAHLAFQATGAWTPSYGEGGTYFEKMLVISSLVYRPGDTGLATTHLLDGQRRRNGKLSESWWSTTRSGECSR